MLGYCIYKGECERMSILIKEIEMDYKESKEDQEVMELAYRLLHEFGWASDSQSKNEFYYELQERVQTRREDK